MTKKTELFYDRKSCRFFESDMAYVLRCIKETFADHGRWNDLYSKVGLRKVDECYNSYITKDLAVLATIGTINEKEVVIYMLANIQIK